MRAGGCTVQQTLTPEAAGVLKHAVALARQRGHAQVTPLHVAATLLAPGASLLRRACLKSHPHSTSHPLQCRALELCFKVALNRLPTTAAPLVHGQPSLSNALVAALKRAQAHQRRGCLEQQQQQPLLAVKVEMEQLIISILDDPSVSRVMREAGFSSTFVKNNLEESSASVSISSLTFPCTPSSLDHHNANHPDISILSRPTALIKGLVTDSADFGSTPFYPCHSDYVNNTPRINYPEIPKSLRSSSSTVKEEDVESVLEVLLRRKARRNAVIVGDCFLTTENVVSEVMIRIERGNNVGDPLRGAQVISPNFPGFHDARRFSRDQVEQKLADLRRAVNNCLGGGPAIIYAGDLKWAVDIHEPKQHLNHDDDRMGNNGYQNNSIGTNGYCAVEHICMELGRILAGHAESGRLWLMATATYQTYMRCQMRQPSLESLWALQAVSVPSGGLTLTLETSSSSQPEPKNDGVGCDSLLPISQNGMWPLPPIKTVTSEDESVDKMNCCSECLAKFEQEAEFLRDQEQRMSCNDMNLPIWLQQWRNVNNSRDIDVPNHVQAKMRDLRKKWNQTCRSRHSYVFDRAQLHRSPFESPQHNTTTLVSGASTPPPWWCTPQTHAYQYGASRNHAWPAVSSPPLAWSHPQFSWNAPHNLRDSSTERPADVRTTLALGFGNDDNCTGSIQLGRTSSVRSSDIANNLRQSDPESLKVFCDRLSEKVQWQSEGNIRAIASSVLQCRSGKARRVGSLSVKGDSWLLALGPDRVGKHKMAQALAEVVYGSKDKLICPDSPWSGGRIQEGNPDVGFRGKTFLDRLTQAIGRNPHCVVLLEDFDQADGVLMSAVSKAMERGKLMDSNGREVSLSDAIVFMTSSVGAQKGSRSVRGLEFDEERLSQAIAEWEPSCGFKLVVQPEARHPFKRRPEWDTVDEDPTQKRNRKSPGLDLNMDASEGIAASNEGENDQDARSMTGNSDVTQETDPQTDALIDRILCRARDCFSQHFLNSLDKCVVFKPFDFAELAESSLGRLQASYGRAANGRGSLHVETSVLERVVSCCWILAPFGKQTLEKWVEDVFEAGLARMLSMHTVTVDTIVKLSPTTEIRNTHENSSYGNSGLPGRLEVEPGLHP